MTPFIAQIMMFAGNFAPRGWAFCDGQLLPISSHTALFSIVGTIYGGDGRATFALPDLRGRAAYHPGRGPGLSQRSAGQKFGAETITLPTAKVANGTAVHVQGGAGQPFNNMPPGLGVNFIIALEGVFPSRS